MFWLDRFLKVIIYNQNLFKQINATKFPHHENQKYKKYMLIYTCITFTCISGLSFRSETTNWVRPVSATMKKHSRLPHKISRFNWLALSLVQECLWSTTVDSEICISYIHLCRYFIINDTNMTAILIQSFVILKEKSLKRTFEKKGEQKESKPL